MRKRRPILTFAISLLGVYVLMVACNSDSGSEPTVNDDQGSLHEGGEPQTIMIGDNIEITVVDIRGDKVRLGITAPPKIPVHRKEVYEAIKKENQSAASVKLEDITNLPRSI